ncbi:hypothetical protein [Rubinisphaera margarita]|uniref:hypothetical protein n=1 Tax=Rubinisphaera margarita TaxID=2909586 RepID=UPI001EE79414|nr:hypothetical protein [Rubinisphaera margarita]MCG6157621.1 hypothetical protein [Rubinisphaera margarita]
MAINPYAMILSGGSHSEILDRWAELSAADQQQAAAEVRDEQIPDIATYIVDTCQLVGVQKTLIFGGMLHLFATVVQPADRQELFENLLEDLDLSRTQAFRCRAVWERFGLKFSRETSLHRHFCAESLKILAEERTPDDAREEAIMLAQNNERITIKRAKALQKKYGLQPVANVSPSAGASTPRAASSRWSFAGAFVRIQLIPAKANSVPDVSKMIADLEAAIAELKAGGPNARVA